MKNKLKQLIYVFWPMLMSIVLGVIGCIMNGTELTLIQWLGAMIFFAGIGFILSLGWYVVILLIEDMS